MSDSQTNEKLLNAQAVGEMLSLSKRQIFRMKSAGLIAPCITVGKGAVRWRQSDIEKWISWGCCSMKEFLARKGAQNDR